MTMTWVKSDGTVQAEGASLAAGTYYAEIPIGQSTSFAVDVVCDGAAIATITIEGTVRSSLTTHVAAGTGWCALPALGSAAPNASATSFIFEVSGASSRRYRLKNVVGTQGVITSDYICKAG